MPQLGEVEIDPAYAATLAPDFLIGDLVDRLATGVEPSDDRMPAFRRHAYSVSAERRLAP